MNGRPDPGTGRAGTGREPAPEAVFALLGNETRVGILQALWDAFESGTGGTAVGFTELFERVGSIEDTGNFSYHLEKLTGPFVSHTDDGYVLKQTGINVIRAVLAGTVTGDPEVGPTPIDWDCPRCGGVVHVEYADEVILLRCHGCPGIQGWRGKSGFLFGGLCPPGVFEDRDVETAVDAAITHIGYHIESLHDGVCPHCTGRVDKWIDHCTDHEVPPAGICASCDRYHRADGWMLCSVCKRSAFPPVGTLALRHPAVRSFLASHGVEHRFASREGLARFLDLDERRLTADPPAFEYTLALDGEELRLLVDERLEVTTPQDGDRT